jgi:hypothetical protein
MDEEKFILLCRDLDPIVQYTMYIEQSTHF